MNQGINGDAYKINLMTKDVSSNKVYFCLENYEILTQDRLEKINHHVYDAEVENLTQHTKGTYKGK